MKILFYGINYYPELTGIGKYSGEMTAWLSNEGAEVKVVTAPPYYPDWKVARGYSAKSYVKEEAEGIDVLRCPLFVPANPTTISRLLHLLSFAFTSFFGLLRQLVWRPDVIVVVEPSLFCAPGALLFGALTRAKTVLHIQDYELDAMFGLGMMRPGLLSKFAFKIECWIMRRFDRVSTISYSMLNRAVRKGVTPQNTVFFPNWVDTDFVTPCVTGTDYRVNWGFSENQKVILYSGNIGNKQGLEIVVESACRLRTRHELQFVIVGNGAHRAELERLAMRKQLSNLHFKELVPYEDLPALMAMADIHLVVQKKGAAEAVLPSKLTSILSAGGHSLITAEPDTELGLLVARYPDIAECVEPENLEAFIMGLERLLTSDLKSVNQVARDYAVNQLNKDVILNRFNQEIHDLCDLQLADSVILDR